LTVTGIVFIATEQMVAGEPRLLVSQLER
jgi:hypothetical protein